ncbi:MAG: acetolactate synthase small subunit [Candidatus Omnitrophica bacterium]|nr:acetolactate synthase small subunit [Candidatus Omnitrophota bacterium]MBU4590608.1 acetolactate synthase small subunit [Candidatus Omnitrophota bacterium]
MKKTIAVLVENQFGVLTHVSGLFSARGFNIDSLAVGETEDPTISRMTIVVDGDEKTLEQVKKQLNRLIDVVKVIDLTGEDIVDRELVLVKLKVDTKNRSEILQVADTFQARIDDVKKETVVIEVTGDQNKIKSFIEMMKPFGIVEIVRTGRIAMGRK